MRLAKLGNTQEPPNLKDNRFSSISRSLTQLSNEVKQHKACSQEVATVPGSFDVVSLLIPLEPHADPIFKESADKTQTCQVGQVLFGHPQELENKTDRI